MRERRVEAESSRPPFSVSEQILGQKKEDSAYFNSGKQDQHRPDHKKPISYEDPAAEAFIFPDKKETEDQHPQGHGSIQEADKDRRRVSQGEISQ